MSSFHLPQSSVHAHVFGNTRTHLISFCSRSVVIFPTKRSNVIKSNRLQLPRKYCIRASSEGLPEELLEDNKFVPINNEDTQFGPPAMMLMGLSYSEVVKVQELLKNMEGDFLKVLICTNEMIKGTLWDAMNSVQPNLKLVKTAKDVPRICFLSGLTGEEIMMFVDAFPEAKLEPVVFAALVPNNAEKTVEELIDEIMGDHELLTMNKSS